MFKSFSIVLIFRVLAAALSFGVNVLVIRELGVAGTGQYFFGLSLLICISCFFRLGLEINILRMLSIKDHTKNLYNADIVLMLTVLFVFLFSILASSIVSIVMMMIGTWAEFGAQKRYWLWIGVAGPTLFAIQTIFCQAFIAVRRPIISIAHSLIFPNLGLFLLYILSEDFSVTAAIVVYLLGVFLSVVIASIQLFRLTTARLIFADNFWDWRCLVSKFNFRIEDYITSISRAVFNWLPFILFWQLFDPYQAGILSVCLRIVSLLNFLSFAVNTYAAPNLADTYHRAASKEFRAHSLKASRLLFFSGAPLIAIIMIFAEQILSVFGDVFSNGVFLLRAFAIGHLFNIMAGISGSVLLMSGHSREMMISSVLSIFALFFALLLCYELEELSAAIAYSTALFVLNALSVIYCGIRIRLWTVVH